MSKEFDIIIFGASGYSSHFIIEELAKASKALNINWAVAGRSKANILKTLETASSHTGIDLNNTPLFIGDAKDDVTLKEIFSKTKLVINCVGPYLFYGEPVIKACILLGVDYVDLCGETLVLEKMQLKYNQAAIESKTYIIGACGFDSIPADLGVIYAQNHFQGRLDSVEGYCEFTSKDWGNGPRINYTTFLSAIMSFTNYPKLREIRSKLMPDRLPFNKLNPVPERPTIFKSTGLPGLSSDHGATSGGNVTSNGDGWCVPFPGTDKSVVMRTQYHLFKQEGKPPIQFRPYFKLDSLIYAICMILFGAIIYVFSKFKQTREFLLKYPQYFTGGMVKVGMTPSRQHLSNERFRWLLIGKGYSYAKNPDLKDNKDSLLQPNHPPDSIIKVIVSGPDAYKATAVCVVSAAITLLKERNKLPKPGGVMTTGVAFKDTGIFERLQGNGINFEVFSVQDNN